MKFKIFSAALALSAIFPLSARNPRLTAQEYQNLNGVIYSIVSKGQPREFKFGEWCLGKTTALDTVYFNSKGLVDYIVDADYAGPSRCKSHSFFYDSDGRIDKITNCGSDYQLYYSNGKLIKVDKLDNNSNELEGRETWTYSPNGFTYTLYNSQGNVEDIHTYTGRKLTKKSISGLFTTDDNYRPIQYDYSNDTYKYLEKWAYNDNGDITSHIARRWIKSKNGWDEIPAAHIEEVFEYEYDDHNNWVRKIATKKEFAPDKTESYVFLREFTYFDSTESLANHINEVAESKRRAAAEAESIRLANIEKMDNEKALREQNRARKHEESAINRLKNDVSTKLQSSLFAAEHKDGYKFQLQERDYCFATKPTIDGENNYSFTLSDDKKYGPYLFDGFQFEIQVKINDKKRTIEYTIPFVVTYTQDKSAALVTNGQSQFILTFNELRHKDKFVLLKR